MLRPHDIIAIILISEFYVLEDISGTIADVDPGGAVGGRTHRLAPLPPEPALASLAVALGLSGFVLGDVIAAGEDLVGQPEHGTGPDLDGQGVVAEVAATAAGADLPEPGQRGDRGVVELGGVVDHEDGPLGLAHQSERALSVGLEDGGVGDFLAVRQSVDGVERCGVMDLLGQGASRMVDDGIGGPDQPSRASDVAESGLAEVEGAERGRGVGGVCHRWAPSEGIPGAWLTSALVYRSHRGT